MTGAEFRDVMAELRMPRREWARLLGTSTNTVCRWATGRQSIAEPTARLIFALAEVPAALDWARERLAEALELEAAEAERD